MHAYVRTCVHACIICALTDRGRWPVASYMQLPSSRTHQDSSNSPPSAPTARGQTEVVVVLRRVKEFLERLFNVGILRFDRLKGFRNARQA